jgi:hypothetical protein
MKYRVIFGGNSSNSKRRFVLPSYLPLQKKWAGTMYNTSGQNIITRITSSIETRFEKPEIFSNRFIETVLIQRIVFIAQLPILLAPRNANFMLAYIFINLPCSNMNTGNTNAQFKVALKILSIYSFHSNKHLMFKN